MGQNNPLWPEGSLTLWGFFFHINIQPLVSDPKDKKKDIVINIE